MRLIGFLSSLTSGDLCPLSSCAVQGQMKPAVADLQLQFLRARFEQNGKQQPVRVPGPELEASRQFPCGGRSWRQSQEAAAGAQEGAGHQLGLRTREGHVALEDAKKKRKETKMRMQILRILCNMSGEERRVWKCHADVHRCANGPYSNGKRNINEAKSLVICSSTIYPHRAAHYINI